MYLTICTLEIIFYKFCVFLGKFLHDCYNEFRLLWYVWHYFWWVRCFLKLVHNIKMGFTIM